MTHVAVQAFGEWSEWGGVGEGLFFPSLESASVRALNRQGIMEIKTERLANGNIMGGGCLGQLGHANEATRASSGWRIDMYGQSAGWRWPISVMPRRHTCVRAQTWGPNASRQERAFSKRTQLQWGGGGQRRRQLRGHARSRWCQQATCDSPRGLALIPTDTALGCRRRPGPTPHAPSNIHSSRFGPKTKQTSLWTIDSAVTRTAKHYDSI